MPVVFIEAPPGIRPEAKTKMVMKSTFFLFAFAFMLITCAIGQNKSSDDDAIRKPATDYIEGWYAGDAARMESALHPELAKRMVYQDPKSGFSQLSQMSAMTLVQKTRAGAGLKIPKDKQLKEIAILDHYNNAAVVKIVASDWVDYLEEVKFNGEWKIINVLWELKPKPTPEPAKN